jgi:membrane-bound lytic murein transglycosylase D
MKNSKTQQLTGRYNAAVIAKHISFNITEFNRYNPDFDNFIAGNSSYELRLPADKMTIFLAKRHDILNESLEVLIERFRLSLDVPPKKN